jgi:hypothetical protein
MTVSETNQPPPIQFILGVLSFGMKLLAHKADHSSTLNAEVKNE